MCAWTTRYGRCCSIADHTHTATFPGHRGINASWPDGRAAEQNRDRAWPGQTQARTGPMDHDSCNPVQIALAEDAIPRVVGVCVRANGAGGGDHRVLAAVPATKMADITLRWSHGRRLWRCTVGGGRGRVQAGRRRKETGGGQQQQAQAGSAQRTAIWDAVCGYHVGWEMGRRLGTVVGKGVSGIYKMGPTTTAATTRMHTCILSAINIR